MTYNTLSTELFDNAIASDNSHSFIKQLREIPKVFSQTQEIPQTYGMSHILPQMNDISQTHKIPQMYNMSHLLRDVNNSNDTWDDTQEDPDYTGYMMVIICILVIINICIAFKTPRIRRWINDFFCNSKPNDSKPNDSKHRGRHVTIKESHNIQHISQPPQLPLPQLPNPPIMPSVQEPIIDDAMEQDQEQDIEYSSGTDNLDNYELYLEWIKTKSRTPNPTGMERASSTQEYIEPISRRVFD